MDEKVIKRYDYFIILLHMAITFNTLLISLVFSPLSVLIQKNNEEKMNNSYENVS